MPLPARHGPFIGREREVAVLLACLETAGNGAGGVALVAGEPGIGKTRLLAELTRLAREQGWTVLEGRAYESAGMPPYLPVSEPLCEYVTGRSAAELRSAFGTGTAEVARLVPTLRDLLPDLPEPPAIEPEQARYRLFAGVAAALAGIARAGERGLLLILDDVHWADAATLQLLQHLAQALAEVPLLLALGYRTVDPTVPTPLQDALAAFSRAGVATYVPLRSLQLAETAALVQGVTGTSPAPALAAAVQRVSAGNPFFAGELARQLQAEGRDLADSATAEAPLAVPEGVRQVVARRLRRLSAAANQALQVAAVLEDGFSVAVLQRAGELGERLLLEAVEDVLAAGMLQEESGGYAFAHALIRQTILEALSPPRKQRLHALAAEAIESTFAGKLAPHAAALATHYRLAETLAAPTKTLQYSLLAARQAGAVFAHAEAVRLLEQALAAQAAVGLEDATARCDLLLELADALIPAGEGKRAAEVVAGEAFKIAHAASDGDRAGRASALALLGLTTGDAGPGVLSPEYRRWAERLDSTAGAGTVERVVADARLAWIAWMSGDMAEHRSRAERAWTLARRLGDPRALFTAGHMAIVWAGQQDEPRRL